MSIIEVFILSFIEGLTEFIPVSSTGHLILTSNWLGIASTEFTKAFEVIIQFGAILAVIYLYKEKLKFNYEFYLKVFLAFIPAAVVGFLLKNKIEALMDSTTVVACALIAGGIVLVFIDSIFRKSSETTTTRASAFYIGLFQCLAMIPGVSRSAATIIGGQFVGLSKEKAAEFSFILAIPTLAAATFYKLWKIRETIDASQITNLGLGVFLSFVFSIFAIKFFLSIVTKYGFKFFGIYRILLGLIVLVTT